MLPFKVFFVPGFIFVVFHRERDNGQGIIPVRDSVIATSALSAGALRSAKVSSHYFTLEFLVLYLTS